MDGIWIQMRITTLIIKKLTFFKLHIITIYFSCLYFDKSHLLAIVTAMSFKNDLKSL